VSEARGPELVVEKLVPGGEGLTRLPDGQLVFVRGVVPGDRVVVREVERRRGALACTRFELLEPGAGRVQPECPVAEACGGCDWMHLSRSAELEQKASLLREALERVGGVTAEPESPVTTEVTSGYRSRVRFHVRGDKLGFFARGTHQLVEVPSCLVADPRLNQALTVIRRAARRHPGALGGFSDVELRATESGVSARFVARDGIKPVSAAPLLKLLSAELSVAGSEREASALVEERRLPGDVRVEIPADAFSQINVAVNERLVQAVLDGAQARKLATFCDLFAGVGNFALPLARQGLEGVMVEKQPNAVQAARRAIDEQGLSGLEARAVDAARGMKELAQAGRRFELVLLDPPREGAPEVVQGVRSLGPRAVAYVACDPVTLARDLKPLVASGLKVSSVQAFDMFPRTHHFETLVWLEG
jgi:23S rRNA (uracil1939-C5)-methyltransferase